jgi:hypothetical protein
MMPRVVSVHALEGFRLAVRFDDGTEGETTLANRHFGPVFEPLRNPDFFAQAFVDEYGAIAWPNGADLAPDSLYESIRASASLSSPA